MPSRSPSRRSSPLSPRSRPSSQRSPSFGMHGNSRRGRSSPTDGRSHRMLSRGAAVRGSDGSRGRGTEVRQPPRSIPSGSYPQGQYAGMSHGSSQHSPRRVAPAAVKRHSYSPPLPVVPSTSGLKRKYMPLPRSSSSSSSSPPRPQHRHMQLLKKKKLAVGRMASSREPPLTIPVRKRSRSKSPLRDKVHHSRSSSHYNMREEGGSFDGGHVSKGNTYSVVRTSGQAGPVGRNYSTSPRRLENPPKRFVGEPIVRYTGGESDVGDGRPIYRGPDKTDSASYSDRELKQIKIGIRQKLTVDEPRINRQIVNPEDIVVVRRPDGSLAAVGVQDDMYKMVSIRMDNGKIVEALCKVPTGKVDLREGLQNASVNGCEGARPIFEREELREVINSADDGDGKYIERERRSRQDYHLGGEERQRVMARQLQPVEERVVALVDDDGPTTLAASSSHCSLRAHRSRSPLPSSSRTGDAHLESISPHPFPSVERQGRRGNSRSYSNLSPSPPPRIASSYGSVRSRDYEQAGTSRTLPSMSSQSRHKEGRRGEDLRYELEYRRRDDSSYERGNRELRTDSDGASSDLRMRINEKRTSDHRTLSHYHGGESTPVIHSKVVSERQYAVEHRRAEGPQEHRSRGSERGGGHHTGVPSQHDIMESEDYQSRSSFHNKSSSSSIPSWDGNPEYVPKGRAYYEHDNRDEEWVQMGRGGGGPRGGRGGRFPRGMGGRGRSFRGGYNPRGRGRGRGGGRGFFGGVGGPGRGYTRGGGIRRAVGRGAAGMGGSNSFSRGKATSPSLWKHDMFENLSSDENRPSSTSEVK